MLPLVHCQDKYLVINNKSIWAKEQIVDIKLVPLRQKL